MGDKRATNNHQLPNSQNSTALAWTLDELERNQEKENHLNTISKMMGTLVHIQLYTFSYRKAVIRPQNMPKTADCGVKSVKIRVLKNGPTGPTKVFLACRTNDKPMTIEKKNGAFSSGWVTRRLSLKKKDIKQPKFPLCRNWPICHEHRFCSNGSTYVMSMVCADIYLCCQPATAPTQRWENQKHKEIHQYSNTKLYHAYTATSFERPCIFLCQSFSLNPLPSFNSIQSIMLFTALPLVS